MKLLADIATHTWSKTDEDPSSFSVNLYFGFRDNGELPVIFNGISFGYKLENSDGMINEDHSPKNGLVYISSDQDYVFPKTVNELVPDKEYTLNVWAENAGIRWEDTFVFTLPRPAPPFDSWSYNEEIHTWEAPVAYPQDGGMYEWDEELQNWV